MNPLTWTIPDRLRRPLKWVGYPVFAVVCFVLSIWASLPRDRIRDRLATVAGNALGGEITTGDFGLTLLSGPGVTASDVILKVRPAAAGEKPTRYSADDVTVHFSLYQLIRGFTSTTFSGHIAGGKVKGKYRFTPEESALAVKLETVSLKEFPGLPAALGIPGVPVDGTIDIDLDVTQPKSLFAQAEGAITISCDECVVGDGKGKLVIPGNPYFASGLTVPKVKLGKIGGQTTITAGRAVFKDLKAHSADIDLIIDGNIELRDPLPNSLLHLYVRIKPSEALLKREAALEAVSNVAGAQARRSDGFFGLSITGAIGAAVVLPSKDAPPSVNAIPPAPAARPTTPMGQPFIPPLPPTRPTPNPPRPAAPVAPPPNHPSPPATLGTPEFPVPAPPPKPPPPPPSAAPPSDAPPPPPPGAPGGPPSHARPRQIEIIEEGKGTGEGAAADNPSVE